MNRIQMIESSCMKQHRTVRWATPIAVLFWLGVLGASWAAADYQPLPLFKMVATADVIVVGTIAEVDAETFKLTSNQFIQGPAQETFRVKRYVPWNDNGPWTNDHKGQQLMLFLSKPASTDASTYLPAYGSTWQIMGAVGEGELPIENQSIYLGGVFLPGFSRQTYALTGGEITGYRFVRDEFFEAVAQYAKCFQMKKSAGNTAAVLTKTCSDDTLEQYRQGSAINRLLVEQSLKALGATQP